MQIVKQAGRWILVIAATMLGSVTQMAAITAEPGVSLKNVDVTFEREDKELIQNNDDPWYPSFDEYPILVYKCTINGIEMEFQRYTSNGVVKVVYQHNPPANHLVIPETINYCGSVYPVSEVRIHPTSHYGEQISESEWEFLKVKSFTIPSTIKVISGGSNNFEYVPIYFMGKLPRFELDCISDPLGGVLQLSKVYVADKDSYEDYKQLAVKNKLGGEPRAKVIPWGWDFEWRQVAVNGGTGLKGAIADKGWNDPGEFYKLSVSGSLNEADLRTVGEMKNLRELDLSAASFAEVPESFMDGHEYIQLVKLPSGVDKLRARAFWGCSELQRVQGFKGTEIGYQCFLGDGDLEELFTENITKMDEAALNCVGLKEIRLPKLNIVPPAAFQGSKKLEYADVSGAESIDYAAFSQCESLSEILVSEGLKMIGTHAFEKTALVSFDMPDAATSLGLGIFEECVQLEHIKFPKRLEVIPKFTCHGCENLVDVVLPENLIEIGYKRLPGEVTVTGNTFSGCFKLSKIELPSTLKWIGPYAFSNTNISEINLPESLEVLDLEAFANTPLVNVKIPDATEDVFRAFKGCEQLKTVSLGKSVTMINSAFQNSSIETVIYHNNGALQTIGTEAFNDCQNYREFYVPSSIIEIGTWAYEGSGVENVTIPENVLTIGDKAFASCENLKMIDFPSSFDPQKTVFEWENYPIGHRCLAWCTQLTTIKSRAFNPPLIFSDSFDNIDKSAIELRVPTGAKALYQSHEYWREFTNIVEDSSLGLDEEIVADDTTSTPVFYDMKGNRLSDAPETGVYLEVKNGHVRKCIGK